LNPHAPCEAQDFKSCASASSATPAQNDFSSLDYLVSLVIREDITPSLEGFKTQSTPASVIIVALGRSQNG
jgi:hypothetical protein